MSDPEQVAAQEQFFQWRSGYQALDFGIASKVTYSEDPDVAAAVKFGKFHQISKVWFGVYSSMKGFYKLYKSSPLLIIPKTTARTTTRILNTMSPAREEVG